MVRPITTERVNEKFVQWKEPLQSTGGAPNGEGEASTSKRRKKKLSRSLGTALGGGSASERCARVEESTHGGSASASTVRAEVVTAHPAPILAEDTLANPPARFVPPRRTHTRASPVPSSWSPSVPTVGRRSPLGTSVIHEDEVAHYLTRYYLCM